MLNDKQAGLLRLLSDGEWHDLEYHSHLASKFTRLVRLGLVHFSTSGQKAQAIATDAGLKYLKTHPVADVSSETK